VLFYYECTGTGMSTGSETHSRNGRDASGYVSVSIFAAYSVASGAVGGSTPALLADSFVTGPGDALMKRKEKLLSIYVITDQSKA
jgi:hypothetical protein